MDSSAIALGAPQITSSDDEELDEEEGEVIESAPPLQIGEERVLGSLHIKKKMLELVHYVGTLLDGTIFYSTRDKSEPVTLTLKVDEVRAPRGLGHCIMTMKKGEIALFTLPVDQGYGAEGYDNVPPNSVIQFEIELFSWIDVVDVRRDGGIIKKIIEKGDKNGKPSDLDEVLVKYQVELLDSTIVAKSPDQGIQFCVNDGHLCPALPLAIVSMHPGEKVKLIVQPQYGFGEEGRSSSGIINAVPPNSVLNIDVLLVSYKPVIDVVGDSKVFKKILRDGEGSSVADDGATVTVSYVAKLEDGTIFERKEVGEEEPLVFVTDEEQVITGLDKAAATMKKGEKAVLKISPEYGFGNVEVQRDLAKVPQCSTLIYEVEMLDFVKEKTPREMNNEEKIEAANRKKEEGNLLYKNQKYQRAAKKYNKAADFIETGKFEGDEEKQLKALRVSCFLNAAACSLKLKNFRETIILCSEVLDIEFQNVKALYRRAQSHIEVGDLISAEMDIKKALEADPENREVKSLYKTLKFAKAESDRRDAKLYANMFALSKKLKVVAEEEKMATNIETTEHSNEQSS
ncbi:70 kDa peptidyl-prolyl isomerase isoform X2 [Arabidopsis lyrata subsp. lyrata]|uniref:70 kDa peptidyl-prolyl isomerase isoform X2 n=1 Tax=Arabidopsis lyrata subsp. lyrata TaxID=81972 RepID=UPI000A29BC8B|nr:70 kDa peptidyl-prolyl isomerase isoform X2 [Arabidopsis lyrata subsp. lyrata]|eukprot:XP_020891758.1 70 kDa peptidyl-prolyl isomerase isoform X2 [Arabidopsis lyrata subsp. lyrata]